MKSEYNFIYNFKKNHLNYWKDLVSIYEFYKRFGYNTRIHYDKYEKIYKECGKDIIDLLKPFIMDEVDRRIKRLHNYIENTYKKEALTAEFYI